LQAATDSGTFIENATAETPNEEELALKLLWNQVNETNDC
jgi:hypothetical protein